MSNKPNMPRSSHNGQVLHANVQLEQCASLHCAECAGQVFTQGVALFVAPAILTPSGREQDIPQVVFICANCGQVSPRQRLEMLTPPQRRELVRKGEGIDGGGAESNLE